MEIQIMKSRDNCDSICSLFQIAVSWWPTLSMACATSSIVLTVSAVCPATVGPRLCREVPPASSSTAPSPRSTPSPSSRRHWRTVRRSTLKYFTIGKTVSLACQSSFRSIEETSLSKQHSQMLQRS